MKKGFFDEFKCIYFWRAVFAELLGATLFVFMITSAHIIIIENKPPVTNTTAPIDYSVKRCLTTGFSAAILVKIFLPISGAHLNPAISSAAYINGDVSSPRASMYSLAHYIGGVLGAGLTWILTPSSDRADLGVVLTKGGVTLGQAFFMEVMLTLILTLCVLSSYDKKNDTNGTLAAIIIGFAYMALHFVGIEYSGGAFNPARAFGPSLVRNIWDDDSWLYWVAPYVGSALAGVMYRFLFKPQKPEKHANDKVTDIEIR